MVDERVNGCFGELNGITVLIEQFNLGFELVGIAELVEKIKFNQDLKLTGIDRGFMLDILQEDDKISVSVIPQSIKFTANALVEVFDGSHAFIDGGALRTYRHAPNTGSRKSWAAGDASSRGVDLALKALTGEMGYPSALSAKFWGYEDVKMKGQKLTIPQEFGSYVMENGLFKISFPTAVP